MADEKEVAGDAADVADAQVALEDNAAIAEAEAIAEQVASARPVRKTAASERKGRETPKQQRAGVTEETKRTGPIQFINECIEELKKVNWPTVSQWRQYFWVVLVFVLFVITYVSLLDLGIGAALLAIFG